MSARYLVTLVLLSGCATTHRIEGHGYDAVWTAARDVMVERDAHAVIDRVASVQRSEVCEEPWYWDAVRWLTLGAFGTTGRSVEVQVERPAVAGAPVTLDISAHFDLLAAYVPIGVPRRAVERDIIAAIEQRLALTGSGDQPLLPGTEPPARVSQPVFDEAASRERTFARRAPGDVDPPATRPPAAPTEPARVLGPAPEGMALVPGGAYPIGEDGSEDDARPRHLVSIDAFWIDKREVTNAEYRAFVEWFAASKDGRHAHPNQPPGKDHVPATWKNAEYKPYVGDDQPVVGVDWFDAYAYASWKGKRLPTEAEWEAAARGPEGRAFPWGPAFAPRLANTHEAELRVTTPVASFPGGASPLGILDLAGNAWEWCADWYAPAYYAQSPTSNPLGPATGEDRVIRGGGWPHPANMARGCYRNFGRPNSWAFYIGFRCAQTAR